LFIDLGTIKTSERIILSYDCPSVYVMPLSKAV
jgi:hypothetical protein